MEHLTGWFAIVILSPIALIGGMIQILGSPIRSLPGDFLYNRTMPARAKHRGSAWNWLLLLPALGLAFPALYARAEPSLFGFPFFYWYQFAWVIGSAVITAIVYARTKD